MLALDVVVAVVVLLPQLALGADRSRGRGRLGFPPWTVLRVYVLLCLLLLLLLNRSAAFANGGNWVYILNREAGRDECLCRMLPSPMIASLGVLTGWSVHVALSPWRWFEWEFRKLH